MSKRGSVIKAKVTKRVEREKAEVSMVNQRNIIGVVLVVLVIFTIFEIFEIMKINVRNNKKPVVMAHWRTGSEYTGLTSMYVYGNNLYLADSTRGILIKYDEMTGKFIKKYELKQGLSSMAQFSDGDVIALSANTIVRFPVGADKPLPGVAIEGCGGASYLAADSKDNLIVVDSVKSKVIKCDANLKKTAEIGQGNLVAPRKVFIGPQDSIYVLDYSPQNKLTVKIFDEKGAMKKQFSVFNNIATTGYESLAITPEGQIYINNISGNSILCYNGNGSLMGKFDKTADNALAITYPPGVAGGLDGKFVVGTAEIMVLQNIKY